MLSMYAQQQAFEILATVWTVNNDQWVSLHLVRLDSSTAHVQHAPGSSSLGDSSSPMG